MSATSASTPQAGQTMWNGNGSPGAVSQSWRGAHSRQAGQRASGTRRRYRVPRVSPACRPRCALSVLPSHGCVLNALWDMRRWTGATREGAWPSRIIAAETGNNCRLHPHHRRQHRRGNRSGLRHLELDPDRARGGVYRPSRLPPADIARAVSKSWRGAHCRQVGQRASGTHRPYRGSEGAPSDGSARRWWELG